MDGNSLSVVLLKTTFVLKSENTGRLGFCLDSKYEEIMILLYVFECRRKILSFLLSKKDHFEGIGFLRGGGQPPLLSGEPRSLSLFYKATFSTNW